MKSAIVATAMLGLVLSFSNHAAADQEEAFCSFAATAAAQALANTNGTLSSIVVSSTSADTKKFHVVLSEKGFGKDTYSVVTGGGHDCIVYSVRVIGEPTRMP